MNQLPQKIILPYKIVQYGNQIGGNQAQFQEKTVIIRKPQLSLCINSSTPSDIEQQITSNKESIFSSNKCASSIYYESKPPQSKQQSNVIEKSESNPQTLIIKNNLQQENQKLIQQLNELQAQHKDCEQINNAYQALQQEYTSLQEKYVLIKKEVDEGQQQISQIEKLCTELYLKQNESLNSSEIQSVQSQQNQKLNEKINSTVNNAYKLMYENLQSDFKLFQIKTNQREQTQFTQNNSKDQEIKDLKNKNELLIQNCENLESSLNEMIEYYESIKKKNQENEEIISQLSIINQQLQQQINSKQMVIDKETQVNIVIDNPQVKAEQPKAMLVIQNQQQITNLAPLNQTSPIQSQSPNINRIRENQLEKSMTPSYYCNEKAISSISNKIPKLNENKQINNVEEKYTYQSQQLSQPINLQYAVEENYTDSQCQSPNKPQDSSFTERSFRVSISQDKFEGSNSSQNGIIANRSPLSIRNQQDLQLSQCQVVNHKQKANSLNQNKSDQIENQNYFLKDIDQIKTQQINNQQIQLQNHQKQNYNNKSFIKKLKREVINQGLKNVIQNNNVLNENSLTPFTARTKKDSIILDSAYSAFEKHLLDIN